MFDIEENLKKLPDTPGVYMHKDKIGQVIYVGKAISLKNRVRQYFQSSYQNSSPKVKAMVSHIASFEYITCGSEMEALILECNLIKKYMPKYNVLLRDDKTYPYIMVTTSEEYPRVVKTRRIAKDGNRYFGPYSDVGAVNRIVDLLTSVYMMKRCSKTDFPKNFRPCLNYHIGVCRGVCIGKANPEEYRKDVDEILEFLEGKDQSLIQKMRARMEEASEKLRFEEAAKWRDAMTAAAELKETQRVTMINGKDLDIVLPVKSEKQSFIVLFSVRDGKLSGRETFPIQSEEEDTRKDLVGAFLKQYYSQWANVPPEILVEEEPEEKELLEEFLSRDGRKVKIIEPKRGVKRKLLDLTKSDIVEMTKTLETKAETRKEQELLVYREMETLAEEGGFVRSRERQGKPFRVESYDISNTNGVDSVGAMVVFCGSKPVRKDYRKFKIRTVEGPNDYGSLQEVLFRRFRRALQGDPSFSIYPDVIMMDGGLGQVSSACQVLDALGLSKKMLVVGLAKDDHHRTRAVVFRDGREILLHDHPILFHYSGTVQEEVHRFAITFHHQLHTKNTMHSMLEDIPGVGEKRRTELLYHFKTMDAIRKASVEQLMEVPSVTEPVARNIVKFFQENKKEPLLGEKNIYK
ncbi:MAG: excinuclease ABC subunit UvrC [Eubacteriales bacterium]|nr:excinuclease ABC subunit UvrC [Eubacteriales bacterium]